MRNNLPITHQEYVLQDRDTIVSKTDLHGNITYVNQDFIRISGFSEQELLGASQKIVRHSDMPKEAFADFWHTLKAGKAWTGMIKNRCKDGSYYWVEANAAPLIENNKVVGYTSIRGKADREQIKAAEAAYRAIKVGNSRLTIQEGQVVAHSAFSVLGGLQGVSKHVSINARLSFMFAVFFTLFASNLVLSWMEPQEVDQEWFDWFDWSQASAALGALLAILFGFILRAGIVRPLKHMLHDIDRMSSGDLCGKIVARGDDELGKVMQSLRILQINVKLLVGQIQQSTVLVNSGAKEIADGNIDLSARTESQASSLEETASAMEQLTATVKQNSDNAHEASNLVVNTSEIAVKGGLAVDQVVETMGAIQESSRKIVDIISVIDGIAFQTNILALNAAVEAARAGEQGRGFAVVATEVRNLAQRSASAAKEIKTLIGVSVEKVEIGGQLVAAAGKTMHQIVAGVQHAAAIMGEISSSSREQSAGIAQVNQAISQMDEITQQNAALVEQAASAAETMQEQAVNLAQLVGAFKLVSGDASANNLPIDRIRKTAVNGQFNKRSTLTKKMASLANPVCKPKSTLVVARKKQYEITSNAEWEEF
ncbi:MAG: methyl-accepting chemotaxis protein [Burkholderiaceae bacterium]